MKSRLPELPVLRAMPAQVQAVHYNRVRLALLRVACPLRLELPHLRGMDLLLGEDGWICVDRTLNDLPVLAWTDFEARARAALHTPVRCRLRFYHAHASLIIRTILEDLDAQLEPLLAAAGPSVPGSVSPIRGAQR
jgi:hypothetical protein